MHAHNIQTLHATPTHTTPMHATPTCTTPTVSVALPTCSTFGNNLVRATGTQAPGLYTNILNLASCAGNATAWNLCYYSGTSEATMVSYFAVYRPPPTAGASYSLVGSVATYSATRNLAIPYVCDHIPIPQSQQYAVQPGDVLTVCLKKVGSGYQGMVAHVAGASVLMASSDCTSPGAMTPTLNIAVGFVSVADITIHISMGKVELLFGYPYMSGGNLGRCLWQVPVSSTPSSYSTPPLSTPHIFTPSSPPHLSSLRPLPSNRRE